jgi:hypothetical protein
MRHYATKLIILLSLTALMYYIVLYACLLKQNEAGRE